MNNEMELDIMIYPEKHGDITLYSIWAVQVPNVVTQGETIEEAKKNLKEALELYFEEMPSEKQIIVIKSNDGNSQPLISRMSI